MTEEEIRDLLDAQARRAPAAGELPPAVRRRAVRRRRLRLAGATFGVLALAGTGTGLALTVPRGQTSSLRIATEPDPSVVVGAVDETGAVPWVDRPAPPYSAPSPFYTPPPRTDARPCHSSDLATAADTPGALAGSLDYDVVFTNTSATSCILRGAPTSLHGVTSDGVQHPIDASTQRSDLLVPANMPPGGHTRLLINSQHECDAAMGSHRGPSYQQLVIGLPGGGTVRAPAFDPGPDGGAALAGYRFDCPPVGISSFGVNPPEPTYPKPPLAGARATLELPTAVRAGSTLHYVVDLANPTSHDIAISPCPGYIQYTTDFDRPVKQTYALNCDTVHAIAAGKTVRYAMQLAVPANAPTGTATIYWSSSGPQNVSAHGTIRMIGADTPCRENQLTLTIPDPARTVTGGPVVPGKGTSTTVSLLATNRSKTTCSVRGRPTFTLYGNGSKLSATYADAQYRGPPDASPPPVTTVSLAPGKSATATLYWDLGCGQTATSAHLSLPATGASFTVTPAHGWPPPKCWSSNDGGALAADPFRPAPTTATR